MIASVPLLLSSLIASLSGSSQALPVPLDKRVVGSLSCSVVKTGSLTLYNTKTGTTRGVTLANDYRLNDLFTGTATRPSSLDGYGNPRLLSSYKGVAAESFEFSACTESQRPGFEDYSPHSKGVYYGHLSPTSSPSYCINKLSVYADAIYLTSEKCNYSDDSGSVSSYFTLTKSANETIHYLGHTGPNGGIPHADAGAYDFFPGSSKSQPAVGLHDGSPDFSNWVLQLQS